MAPVLSVLVWNILYPIISLFKGVVHEFTYKDSFVRRLNNVIVYIWIKAWLFDANIRWTCTFLWYRIWRKPVCLYYTKYEENHVEKANSLKIYFVNVSWKGLTWFWSTILLDLYLSVRRCIDWTLVRGFLFKTCNFINLIKLHSLRASIIGFPNKWGPFY